MHAAIITEKPQSLLIVWACEHLRLVGYAVDILTQAEIKPYFYDLVVYEYAADNFQDWQPILDNINSPTVVIYQNGIDDSALMQWQPGVLQLSEIHRQRFFEWVTQQAKQVFLLCTDSASEHRLLRWGVNHNAVGSLAAPIISEETCFEADPHRPSEAKPVMLLNSRFDIDSSLMLLLTAKELSQSVNCRFVLPVFFDGQLSKFYKWLQSEIAKTGLTEISELIPWKVWSMKQRPVMITLTNHPHTYRHPDIDYLRVNGVPVLSVQDVADPLRAGHELLSSAESREQQKLSGYQQTTANTLFELWGETFLDYVSRACRWEQL